MARNNHFVLESDWGGQVLLTIPCVLTTERKAWAALRIIDAIEWVSNEGDGAACYVSDAGDDEGVWGGMGGGLTTDSLWLHEGLQPRLKAWVAGFLLGDAALPSLETMVEWLKEDRSAGMYYTKKQLLRKIRKAYRRATWHLGHDVKGCIAVGPLIAGLMGEICNQKPEC